MVRLKNLSNDLIMSECCCLNLVITSFLLRLRMHEFWSNCCVVPFQPVLMNMHTSHPRATFSAPTYVTTKSSVRPCFESILNDLCITVAYLPPSLRSFSSQLLGHQTTESNCFVNHSDADNLHGTAGSSVQ